MIRHIAEHTDVENLEVAKITSSKWKNNLSQYWVLLILVDVNHWERENKTNNFVNSFGFL